MSRTAVFMRNASGKDVHIWSSFEGMDLEFTNQVLTPGSGPQLVASIGDPGNNDAYKIGVIAIKTPDKNGQLDACNITVYKYNNGKFSLIGQDNKSLCEVSASNDYEDRPKSIFYRAITLHIENPRP